jgi:hypothetical protein
MAFAGVIGGLAGTVTLPRQNPSLSANYYHLFSISLFKGNRSGFYVG